MNICTHQCITITHELSSLSMRRQWSPKYLPCFGTLIEKSNDIRLSFPKYIAAAGGFNISLTVSVACLYYLLLLSVSLESKYIRGTNHNELKEKTKLSAWKCWCKKKLQPLIRKIIVHRYMSRRSEEIIFAFIRDIIGDWKEGGNSSPYDETIHIVSRGNRLRKILTY